MTVPPRLVIFDLDDTLAPSKGNLDPTMADLILALLQHVDVCIISGARFDQFQTQVLGALGDSDDLVRPHLMPTCGTRYYRWRSHAWVQIYSQDPTEDAKAGISAASTTQAQALGQAAPVAEKVRWDPDGTKKNKMRDHVAALLPDLEVRSGGSTFVDVTRKGIAKAYGVLRLDTFVQERNLLQAWPARGSR